MKYIKQYKFHVKQIRINLLLQFQSNFLNISNKNKVNFKKKKLRYYLF